MCGRTACNLSPETICRACSFRPFNSAEKYVLPEWKDHPGKHAYSPSTNITPSMFTPVIVRNSTLLASNKETCNEKKESNDIIVQPMMWGLIPSFAKGSEKPQSQAYKTNNARIENLPSSNLYKVSLKHGQRCVVLCQGYYEWKKLDKKNDSQPYFIHAPQAKHVEIWNPSAWEGKELWNEDKGWSGPQLIKMAGLFSRWKSSEGEELFSYTVITMESPKKYAWLHHRIPAILETDEDVKNWLNTEDYDAALATIRKDFNVESYPVSKRVNHSKNKDSNLFYPRSNVKNSEEGSSQLMKNWLSSSKRKKTLSVDEETVQQNLTKKRKTK